MLATSFSGFELLLIPIMAGVLGFWVWMVVSAIQNKGLSDGERIAWLVAIVFGQIMGALVYFFIGHPKRKMAIP